MHILGGFGVAFLTSAVFSYRKENVSYKKLALVYLIIAVAWEAYEHIHNFVAMGSWAGLRDSRMDVIDTIKDIIDGYIGMSIAYLFVRK